jgi:2-dehydro-3-deoxyphosphogluconate aldolase/(4S)-4-hydroxy-2-oxoglutarate aldolase
MESLFSDDALRRMRSTSVIAVLIVDDPKRAVRLARALLAGGVDIMELTLRTAAALDCLKAVTNEVPEMMAGAGTVIFSEQVDQVIKAGAAFAVSPGTNPAVIRRAVERGLPFAPGVVTPTDIDTAVQCGCRELKFFPAEPSGGLKMLDSIKAPYAHLGLQYIPLGGVTTGNLSSYLTDRDVLAVGGSWLAKKDIIDSERWDVVTTAAREAVAVVRQVRGSNS